MRRLAFALIAAACVSFAGPVLAQQLSELRPGEAVDFYTFGKWVPCIVASPLVGGSYSVKCGSIDLRAKPDARELRRHIVAPANMASSFGVESAPAPAALDDSVGARYGTRDPRHCNRRPDHFSSAEAKDVFICDSEREFNGNLYLVSEVSLEVSTARAFNPSVDARKAGIDRNQPIIDIRASYNRFECSQLPASHMDNPNVRNCNEFHTSGASGACFRNTAGEWHCMIIDPTAFTVATGKSVGAPTLVE